MDLMHHLILVTFPNVEVLILILLLVACRFVLCHDQSLMSVLVFLLDHLVFLNNSHTLLTSCQVY